MAIIYKRKLRTESRQHSIKEMIEQSKTEDEVKYWLEHGMKYQHATNRTKTRMKIAANKKIAELSDEIPM
jgi:hypothetical protein